MRQGAAGKTSVEEQLHNFGVPEGGGPMQRCAHASIRKIDWRSLVKHLFQPLNVVGGSKFQQHPPLFAVHHRVHASPVLHERFLVRYCLGLLREETFVSDSGLGELKHQRVMLFVVLNTKKLAAGRIWWHQHGAPAFTAGLACHYRPRDIGELVQVNLAQAVCVIRLEKHVHIC